MFGIRRFAGSIFVLATAVAWTLAQSPTTVPEPILIDEFGQLSHCDFTGRIDVFLSELSQKPDHQGYVLNYKSIDELPGDRDTYYRQDWIAHHISFRQFDSALITLIRSGYLEEARTQLWIVPPGAGAPEGLASLPPPATPDKKTFLFERNTLASDKVVVSFEMGEEAAESLPEFVLESVKAREKTEQEELERQIAEDQAEAEQDTDGGENPELEASHAEHEASAETQIEEPVDRRTEEQREEDRFAWADSRVAELIASRKSSTGMIIFYADDERYDIAKVRRFVTRGRDLLVHRGSLSKSRIKVVFGGYRPYPEAEFWFVPAKGKMPVPTPDERPVEEPEPTVEN